MGIRRDRSRHWPGVIPAHHDGSAITTTLDSVLRSARPQRAGRRAVMVEVALVQNGVDAATHGAIDAWLRAHAGQVSVAREDDVSSGPPSRLRVHLLESAPGKVNALMAAQRILDRRARLSEFVAQLDADTLWPADHDVRRLTQTLRAGNVATSGKLKLESPDGSELSWSNKLLNDTTQNVISGALIMMRPDLFFSTYKAINDQAPGDTEDLELNAALRVSGYDTKTLQDIDDKKTQHAPPRPSPSNGRPLGSSCQYTATPCVVALARYLRFGAKMGTFDFLRCEASLPDGSDKARGFQTEEFSYRGSLHTITASGPLIWHSITSEPVPEEERPHFGQPGWEECKEPRTLSMNPFFVGSGRVVVGAIQINAVAGECSCGLASQHEPANPWSVAVRSCCR